MLPPGHIAAGYIVAEAVIKLVPYNLSQAETSRLAIAGVLAAFAPDLDFFYAFFKTGKLRIETAKVNHRKFPTHTPILWLTLGLVIFFFSQSAFGKTLGLIIWLAPWSHFLLDSEWGIMWFWPFSTKLYPFSAKFYKREYAISDAIQPKQKFIAYWLGVVKLSFTRDSTGYFEILIIIIALAIALHK